MQCYPVFVVMKSQGKGHFIEYQITLVSTFVHQIVHNETLVFTEKYSCSLLSTFRENKWINTRFTCILKFSLWHMLSNNGSITTILLTYK